MCVDVYVYILLIKYRLFCEFIPVHNFSLDLNFINQIELTDKKGSLN